MQQASNDILKNQTLRVPYIWNFSSTNAKLSNFTKLEPTLRLLEIPFDTVRAKEIMTEKQGVAIKLVTVMDTCQVLVDFNNYTGRDCIGFFFQPKCLLVVLILFGGTFAAGSLCNLKASVFKFDY